MRITNYSIQHLFFSLLITFMAMRVLAGLPTFVRTQAIFERGLRGDADAAERSYPGFQRLVQEYPDNPLYLAYLGANETLFARDMFCLGNASVFLTADWIR